MSKHNNSVATETVTEGDVGTVNEVLGTDSATGEASGETTETTETVAEAKAPKAPRRTTSLDREAGVVVFHGLTKDDADTSYPTASLPDATKAYLLVLGARTFLNQGKSPDEAYAKLVAADLPEETAGGPSAPKINPWHQAIANAFVVAYAKSGKPMTEEEAMAKAKALNRSDFAKLKADRAVIREFAALPDEATGTSSSLLTA